MAKIPVLLWCLGFLLTGPTALWGAKLDPAPAVVAVVSLDDQGEPRRQGLGVLVGKNGRVLTSARLLAAGGTNVVRTGKGDKYLVQEILYQDPLQDLALVKVDAKGLPGVEVGAAGRVRLAEAVRVGLWQETGVVLKEARVASVHPFSPRLTLVMLKPSLAEAEPGTPLFDSRAELVGMVHTFAGKSGDSGGFQVILTRDRSLLPREIRASPARKTTEKRNDQNEIVLGEKTAAGSPVTSSLDLKKDQTAGGDQGKQPEKTETDAFPAFWLGVQDSLNLKWQEAQEQFTAALAAPEGLPEASFGRGVARYHLGDNKGAAQDLLEATRRLPHYALAAFWLGKAWERLGNLTEAREAYQRAVSQAPDLKEAWFSLGVLAYKEGRLDEARKCLEQAGNGVDQAGQRAFYLGNIARSQGRLEQARAAFVEAVKQDPGFLPAYVEGSKTLLDLGRPQEAVGLLTELRRRDPKLPLARYYLALAHQASWNAKEAWEQYLALQQLDPALASRLAPLLEQRR
jgi:tetratricopeptide (TPR) repeat protein